MKTSIENLLVALRDSWSADTAFPASGWTANNPARGQCVTSSLVLQEFLGGDLQRYEVTGDGIAETHYCNILDDGTILDATACQYSQSVTLLKTAVDLKGFASIRDKRLADTETRDRYELLLQRVKLALVGTSVQA